MWPFKSKVEKVEVKDIEAAKSQLDKQVDRIEKEIEDANKSIEELKAKGIAEKSREIKIHYAKRINALEAQKKNLSKRATFILYNRDLLDKLQGTKEDTEFFKNINKSAFGDALTDQKALNKFLKKALDLRTESENSLVSAEDSFIENEEAYIENDRIYGIHENDDELLAMFETESQLNEELGIEPEEDLTIEKLRADKEM